MSRGSHGIKASGGVIGYHHEGRPMDLPHVHDIHPGTNWGTRQGPGMEDVKNSYLSQREVTNKISMGIIGTRIPALSMPGRADYETASSTSKVRRSTLPGSLQTGTRAGEQLRPSGHCKGLQQLPAV